jgi:hypothetical protein
MPSGKAMPQASRRAGRESERRDGIGSVPDVFRFNGIFWD